MSRSIVLRSLGNTIPGHRTQNSIRLRNDIVYNIEVAFIHRVREEESSEFSRGFAAFTTGNGIAKDLSRNMFWLKRREEEWDFENSEKFETYHGLGDTKGILDIPTARLIDKVCRKAKHNQRVQRTWI